MKVRALAAAVAAALILAACGGGGDDAPVGVTVPSQTRSVAASAGSDVTSSNYTTLAAPLARALIASFESSASSGSSNSESALSVGNVARYAINASRPDRQRSLAVFTDTQICPVSGAITTSYDDRDNSGDVSRGDVITSTLQNCVIESGGPVSSGIMTTTINAVEFNANRDITALDASVTLSNLTVDGSASMTGTYRSWSKLESPTSTRARVNYQGVSVNENGSAVTYDFDEYGIYTSTTGSFDLQGGLRIGGQTYSVVPGNAFSFTTGFNPTIGSVSLRDAAGDTMVLRVSSSTSVTLEFYPAGASTPSATTTVTWDSLRR